MAIHEPSFTLGIEEEYLLVDKDSRDQIGRASCWVIVYISVVGV